MTATTTRAMSLLLAPCLLLLVKIATAEQQRQLLARAESSLGSADWLEGGSCGEAAEAGCRREAISARATVLAQPFEADACGVVERSGGDGYTMDDVTDGFTFGVLHTCESEGEVLAQGTEACSYSVCATFSWNSNGTLAYEVMVSHSMGTGSARTITLDVYLNYDDESGAPVSGDSTAMQCSPDNACPEATDCAGDSAEVKVLIFDSIGDGWSDPFGEATEFWKLAGPTGSWSGNLMKGHVGARSTLCLADGEYDFSAPGSVSWPNDVSWTVCDTTGFAGQAMTVTVANGACSVPEDVVQVSPLALNAPGTGNDGMCDLCSAYVLELDGSHIGAYTDEECDPSGDTDENDFSGSGGGSGCTVGSYFSGAPVTCRFCVANRELWAEENPGARDPDWPDCPCCVSDLLGQECTTVDVAGSDGIAGFVDTLSSANIAVLALGSAVALALCILAGCCCSAAIEKKKKEKADRQHGDKHKPKREGGGGGGGGRGGAGVSAQSLETEQSRSPRSRPPSRESSRRRTGARNATAATEQKTGGGWKLFKKQEKKKPKATAVASEIPMPPRGVAPTATKKAKKSKDPRDLMPDPDFYMYASMSSTGDEAESFAGAESAANPMFDRGGRGARGKDLENGLYGLAEEKEEEDVGVSGPPNPLFDPRRTQQQGQQRGQGARNGNELADALYSGADFERSQSTEDIDVEVISSAIPQRFLSAARRIQVPANNRRASSSRRMQDEAGQAGHRYEASDPYSEEASVASAPESEDPRRSRPWNPQPAPVAPPRVHIMRITPKHRKSSRRSVDGDTTSDDVGGGGGSSNHPRRRSSGSGRTRRPARLDGGGGGDGDGDGENTAFAPPTSSTAGGKGHRIQRTRSFGSDSSFTNMARTLAESSPFRPGRESLRAARSAITRSSPRHQRFQVAPRSKGVASGDEDEENPRSKPGKRSSRRGEGSGEAHDDGGQSRSRDPESESSRRREERRNSRRARGSGSLESDEARRSSGSGGIAAASSRRRRAHGAGAAHGGSGRRRDGGRRANPAGRAAAEPSNSESGSPTGRPRRAPSSPGSSHGSSFGGSNDGSIIVPTVTASSKLSRPETRLSDILAGKVRSGKMRRGSSGKSHGDVPLLDLRRASTKTGELSSGGGAASGAETAAAAAAAAANEWPRPVSLKGNAATRAEIAAVVAAGDRERHRSSGGGGGGRPEGGVLTKAYIRKPEAEEERRRREKRRVSRRDSSSSRAASRKDRKREGEHEQEDLLVGTPFSSAEADGDGAAAALEAVTRAARNFNKMYSSGSEAGEEATDHRRRLDTDVSQGFSSSGKPPEGGGDDDGVAPRSSSATGGAQAAPQVKFDSAEDPESVNAGAVATASAAPPAMSSKSFASAAKELQASATAQSSSADKPSRRDAASGRARVRRSGSGGSSGSSGSDGEGSGSGSGSGGSVSFHGGGDDGDDADVPATAGKARGRGQYRQSNRSRMRELAYQAARSRSRGSCRSVSSLQRVEEVSEESLSSLSPLPATMARHGESGAAVEREGRGPRLDNNTLDDDIPSLFHSLTRNALEQQQQQQQQQGTEEEQGRRAAAPPSTAGGDSVADLDDETCVSSSASAVSPSGAPRYAVSGIMMSGNAAAVAADKRRRMSSLDEEEFSSNGSRRVPLGSPALPAFVSRGFSGGGSAVGSDGDSAAGSGAKVSAAMSPAVNLWQPISPIRAVPRGKGTRERQDGAAAATAPGNEGPGDGQASAGSAAVGTNGLLLNGGADKTGGGDSCLSTPTSTTSSRAWGPDGAAAAEAAATASMTSERSSRMEAGGRVSRRKQAKIRRAMVLAVQKKAKEDEGLGTLPPAKRPGQQGPGMHGSTGASSRGGGVGPGIFAATRPPAFCVSGEAVPRGHHSAGEERYGAPVGGGAPDRPASQGDGGGARGRVRLSSIGSVGSAGGVKYSGDRSAPGGGPGAVDAVGPGDGRNLAGSRAGGAIKVPERSGLPRQPTEERGDEERETRRRPLEFDDSLENRSPSEQTRPAGELASSTSTQKQQEQQEKQQQQQHRRRQEKKKRDQERSYRRHDSTGSNSSGGGSTCSSARFSRSMQRGLAEKKRQREQEAAAAGKAAAQGERRSTFTRAAADAAGLHNAGSSHDNDARHRSDISHSPPQSRGEPSGEVASSTSSLRRSEAEQLKLRLQLEQLKMERGELELEREREREQEEGSGRRGSLRSERSAGNGSVESGEGVKDANLGRHRRRREGKKTQRRAGSGRVGSVNSSGSGSGSSGLGQPDPWGIYGFLRPSDQDRSRGSVDDPKRDGQQSYRR